MGAEGRGKGGVIATSVSVDVSYAAWRPGTAGGRAVVQGGRGHACGAGRTLATTPGGGAGRGDDARGGGRGRGGDGGGAMPRGRGQRPRSPGPVARPRVGGGRRRPLTGRRRPRAALGFGAGAAVLLFLLSPAAFPSPGGGSRRFRDGGGDPNPGPTPTRGIGVAESFPPPPPPSASRTAARRVTALGSSRWGADASIGSRTVSPPSTSSFTAARQRRRRRELDGRHRHLHLHLNSHSSRCAAARSRGPTGVAGGAAACPPFRVGLRTGEDGFPRGPGIGPPADAATMWSGRRTSRSKLPSLPAGAGGEATDPAAAAAVQASPDTIGSSGDDGDGETASLPRSQRHRRGIADDSIPVPSLRTIVRFASTTVLIWLSEPLLSLVDTTVVGRYAGATRPSHLAGLGPATMLCDSSVYLTYFLSIATTNRLTTAAARGDVDGQARVISHALGVAAALGVGIALFSWFAGPTVLGWIVGGEVDAVAAAAKSVDGMEPSSVLAASVSYVRVRGLAAPAAVVGSVAQAACLSVLDTRTPALAVAVAAAVNIVGDVALCRFGGMGIEGAAVATAAASLCGCAVLLRSTRARFLSLGRERRLGEAGAAGDGGGTGGGATTTTAVAAAEATNGEDRCGDAAAIVKGASEEGSANERKHRKDEQRGQNEGATTTKTTSTTMPFISLPDSASFVRLVRFAGPIFLVIVGKLVCYSAMTMRANRFGMAELAAHGVMMRIFFFHATFGDSLSQCAQTFLPAVLYRGTATTAEDEDEYRDGDEDNRKGGGEGHDDGVNGEDGPLATTPPSFEVVGSGDVVESSDPSGGAEASTGSAASPGSPPRAGDANGTSSSSSPSSASSSVATSDGTGDGNAPDAAKGRRTAAVRSLLSRLLLLSSVVAVTNGLSATRIVGSHGSWFTADDRIATLMGGVPQRTYMGLALFLHPYIMMLEGSIIAGGDVRYLVMNYAVTIGLVMAMLFWRWLRCCDSFGGVWRALFLFQVVRLVQFSTRVWRRNVRE